VDLGDPTVPLATLDIHYTHQLKDKAECAQWYNSPPPADSNAKYTEWMTRCYYDYIRVLTPNGSHLVGSTTQPVPDRWMDSGVGDDGAVHVSDGEASTMVMSVFQVVPLGGELQIGFRYHLPPAVLIHDTQGWHYQLKLQKQPGTNAIPFTVNLRLPPAASLISSSIVPAATNDRMLSFAIQLDRDQTIDVRFSTDSAAK
jgi:hypothetical protein